MTNLTLLRQPGSQATEASALSRRAAADRCIDEALTLAASDLAGDELLLQSLRLDPEWVNAYWVLAQRWAAREGLAGRSLSARLHEVWARLGQGNERALQFIQQFAERDPYRLSPSLVETLPETALILRVGEDLETLDVFEYERLRRGQALQFLGRVHEPRLMCSLRDFQEFPATKRAIVEDLVKLGKDSRVVLHGGTVVSADRRVFGPAIDTLHFHKVLRRHVYTNPVLMDPVRTVCEIGSGSGFLLCSLAAAFSDRPVTLLASDVSDVAVELTNRNLGRTLAELHGFDQRLAPVVRVHHTPNLLRELPTGTVDLLLTNPPYIPEYRASTPNPYGGTEVIADMLLHDGPRVLSPRGVMLILYSSLCEAVITRYLADSRLVAIPIGSARRVPLDLREVVGDPAWMKHLRGKGLEEDLEARDFTFWHTLRMLCLVHPSHPLARCAGMP